MFAKALLAKAGHHVHVAENGHQAVDALRYADYDVILMDVQMPELDGIGAMHEIRSLPSPKCAIPIIAMTANAMSGAEAGYLKAGMDDYISKPVQPEILFSKLARVASSTEIRPPNNSGQANSNGPSTDAIASVGEKAAVPVVLDTNKLFALSGALSSVSLANFLSLYKRDTDSHVRRVSELVERRELADAGRLAHDLVSTAGNIGANQMSALACQLEAACVEHNQTMAILLVEELIAAHTGVSSAIRNWMQGSIPLQEGMERH